VAALPALRPCDLIRAGWVTTWEPGLRQARTAAACREQGFERVNNVPPGRCRQARVDARVRARSSVTGGRRTCTGACGNVPNPLSYTPPFFVCSHMNKSRDFEISLVIGLRMVGQSTRADDASRHAHTRDAAGDACAKIVIQHLQRSGWQLTHPPAPLPLYRASR